MRRVTALDFSFNLHRDSLSKDTPPLLILSILAIMKAYHVAFLASLIFSPCLVFAAQSSSARAVSESKYTRAHSLGDNYSFNPQEGWQSLNVTNLQYKYRRQEDLDPTGDLRSNSRLENRSKKKANNAPNNTGGLGRVIAGVVAGVWAGLKGLGKPEPAIITWYFLYFVLAGAASQIFPPGIRDMTWRTPAAGLIAHGRPRSVVFNVVFLEIAYVLQR